ncbi:MAG TPA: universal stress protein [Vicinamibacterales bacterium]|nr:universal stress protein [Vicinamibacterales bacterium]
MWTYPPAHVVVAVDFGEASAQAVALAAAIAAAGGGRLTLVHAETLEAPPYFTADQIDAIEHQRIAAREEARRYLTRFGQRRTGGHPFAAEIVDGPPAEAVLRAGAAADLIAMGTHGRRGPGRWWMGSVAERVLRRTGVPLLVTHGDAGREPAAVFQRLLPAGDGAVRERVTRYARALAGSFGGTALDGADGDVGEAARRQAATLVLVGLGADERRRGLDATERLLRSCTLPTLFLLEREHEPAPR